MLKKTCERCSIIFETKVSNKKFCGSTCFLAHRKEYAKNNFESRRVVRRCRQCDDEYRRPYKKSGFCSRSCGSKWNLENGHFEDWRKYTLMKRGKLLPCVICKKLSYRPPRDIGSDGAAKATILCSAACHSKHMSVLFSGENNPMFGKKLSDSALEKQKRTLLQNHGVSNAFFLSKHRNVSKAQQKILSFLTSSCPDALFESEKYFVSSSHRYFIDIFSEPLKLIVEYNGDYWHCHPKKYDSTFFHPKKQMFAKDIWEKDEERLSVLKKNGYTIHVIWEDDYKKDVEATLVNLSNVITTLSGGINGS